MPKTIAVLAGFPDINLNSSGYDGWTGFEPLPGCTQDLKNMRKLLEGYKFDQLYILSGRNLGTAQYIIKTLEYQTSLLKAGDLFVFYFTGHGVQAPHPERIEKDGFDDAICCYDRPLLDLELGNVWAKVGFGVRIVMMSDSCHSGTNAAILSKIENMRTDFMKSMSITASSSSSTYPRITSVNIKAMLIHYGACEDRDTSAAYDTGSPFTDAIYELCQEGKFPGNYPALCQAIIKKTQERGLPQIAQYNELGPRTSLEFNAFRNQKPFTIGFPRELLHTTHKEEHNLESKDRNQLYVPFYSSSEENKKPENTTREERKIVKESSSTSHIPFRAKL